MAGANRRYKQRRAMRAPSGAPAYGRHTKPPHQVHELIGRSAIPETQSSMFRSRSSITTVDQTIPDYEFWDLLRRCKAKGYTLGGLFAKRIERVIASWVLGGGVVVELYESMADALPEEGRDYTNALLAEFVGSLLDAGADHDEDDDQQDNDDRSSSLLMTAYRDSMGLGDQYIIVNADGTLSVPSPDTVTLATAPLDYRKLISVTVTTKFDGYVITDEYRADGRTVTVKKGMQVLSVQQYENLIGRIPVVHIAHDRSGNETHGHPIHEELRPLYDQYDDLIYKQLDGAKLLGNPLLTFAGMEDINEVINANDPATDETYYDRDGNEVPRKQLNIDSNAVLLIGKGGSASFTSPPVGFTEDTKTGLKSLFLLLLDHTGIPEYIWGGEVASGRSSSETQGEQFEKDIAGWRMDAGGWIVRLCKIWLQTRALTDPKLIVGRLALAWPALSQDSKETKLKYIELGREEELLTDETTLALLDLVDDPTAEVAKAKVEADARREKMFPEGDTNAFRAGLNGAAQEDELDDAEEAA